MPPLNAFSLDIDELTIQKDGLHLSTEHHYTIVDNINAILHGNIFPTTNGKLTHYLSLNYLFNQTDKHVFRPSFGTYQPSTYQNTEDERFSLR
jgi:hypothetical protein